MHDFPVRVIAGCDRVSASVGRDGRRCEESAGTVGGTNPSIRKPSKLILYHHLAVNGIISVDRFDIFFFNNIII